MVVIKYLCPREITLKRNKKQYKIYKSIRKNNKFRNKESTAINYYTDYMEKGQHN